MKIKIVYFAYLVPNHWEPIIKEQLDALKNLNLYNIAASIYMSVISNPIELSKLKIVLEQNYNKIQLKNIFVDNIYEYPGIKTIYQIAEDDDDTLLLYFHSKGMTSNQHDIRNFLFKNTIENYKDYVNEFKTNKKLEVAGAMPHSDGFCYFNFFWARSSYVRNYCERPEISTNRYIWEVWIGNEFSRKRKVVTYSSFIGYDQLYNGNEIWAVHERPKVPFEKSKQKTACSKEKINIVTETINIISDKSFLTEVVNESKTVKEVIKEEKPMIKEEKPVIKEEKPLIKEEKPLIKEEKPLIKEEKPIIKEKVDIKQNQNVEYKPIKLENKNDKFEYKPIKIENKDTPQLNKDTAQLNKDTPQPNKDTTQPNKDTTQLNKDTTQLNKDTTQPNKDTSHLNKEDIQQEIKIPSHIIAIIDKYISKK